MYSLILFFRYLSSHYCEYVEEFSPKCKQAAKNVNQEFFRWRFLQPPQ